MVTAELVGAGGAGQPEVGGPVAPGPGQPGLDRAGQGVLAATRGLVLTRRSSSSANGPRSSSRKLADLAQEGRPGGPARAASPPWPSTTPGSGRPRRGPRRPSRRCRPARPGWPDAPPPWTGPRNDLNERERAADQGNHLADQRERDADQRKHLADQRERDADARPGRPRFRIARSALQAPARTASQRPTVVAEVVTFERHRCPTGPGQSRWPLRRGVAPRHPGSTRKLRPSVRRRAEATCS